MFLTFHVLAECIWGFFLSFHYVVGKVFPCEASFPLALSFHVIDLIMLLFPSQFFLEHLLLKWISPHLRLIHFVSNFYHIFHLFVFFDVSGRTVQPPSLSELLSVLFVASEFSFLFSHLEHISLFVHFS